MLAAISLLLVYLIHFPIFPGAAFLEYDMADVPILIATFLFGPGWGLLLTGVVSLLQWFLISPASGWVGFVSTLSQRVVRAYRRLIYQHNRTRKTAILSLILGSMAMIAMMIPLNLVFTVYFLGAPRQVVIDMLLPIIIPFNTIKAFGNGIITFALYKAVGKVLRIERAPKQLDKNSVTE
jgi:riboflavin transporter FmnP